DHVEWYVGNAKQAAFYYCNAFGFREVAYAGLETGVRDRTSHVLMQGRIKLVLTGALGSDSPIADHQRRHGDGVKVIALAVDDVEAAHRETTARGAVSAWAPREEADEFGVLRTAAIRTYGEVLHVFVDRGDYTGAFAPGYRPLDLPAEATGLAAIDHVVGNVQLGKMNTWVRYYHEVMGFRQLIHFDDQDIGTEYSALMSKVMQDGTGRVKFPINEPAEGKRKSQIEEYLDYHLGPGVQHIAMASGDILATVRELRRRGVEFLRVPEAYYSIMPGRVGEIEEPLEAIRELGILVDRDDEGYLLQIFSRPIQDRPTSFIEVIERHGSRGFGKGNFKALFEALEMEQARRGNL
ncbi:MAG: 4-hydroxyphenylpyruvate dioxygenase, partial [Anaerolineales bacterium]